MTYRATQKRKTKAPDPWKSLNALLGVYGVMTSRLMSNQDYWTCAKALWGKKITGFGEVLELQKQIKGMSKQERRNLAVKNIKNLPEQFISQADVHQYRLARSLQSPIDNTQKKGE